MMDSAKKVQKVPKLHSQKIDFTVVMSNLNYDQIHNFYQSQ
jgi:hypothetical protein